MTPTPEQSAIISAARESQASLMIQAYAGAAKTTTLVMVAGALSESGLALAFNRKIKDELERKFPKSWQVLTLNGLGHRAWGKAVGRGLALDKKKLGKIITALGRPYNLTTDEWDAVRQLTTCAMMQGLVPKSYPHRGLLPDTVESWEELADMCWLQPEEKLLALAHEALCENIRQGFQGTISFDDQIYLSACLGGVFPRFPLTLVDEAQDLSAINHVQLARCSAGRIIAVGDSRQSIYAFRGAHSSSMERIRALRKEWVNLPLATTFRCPHKVVARQQAHAPGFRAYETNALGRVLNGFRETLREGEEPLRPRVNGEALAWAWSDIAPLGEDIAVLSRNNAQLISMAFKLLRQRVGCKMLGRDIGKSLVVLSKKILPLDDTPTSDCVVQVDQWRQQQSDLAWANGHEEKIASITDRAESLLAVLDGAGAKNAGELRQELERLFAREAGSVTLSTVHRAKGLEWEVVVALDPWRIPSRFAQKQAAAGRAGALEQEHNLKYVMETRAKQVLVLVNLEEFA